MLKTSSNSVRHNAVPLKAVLQAARTWASRIRDRRPEIVRISYFGSYARGDYVPGSDFDVLIELAHSDITRPADRTAGYLPDRFPVAMELFVYTSEEIQRMHTARSSFLEAVASEQTLLS